MVNEFNDTILIKAVTEEQNNLNLSDRRLSQLIGVSPSLWSQIKAGKKGFGKEVLAGICRVLPVLQSEVLAYLRGNHVNEH